MWFLLQTVVIKFSGLLTQFALAYLLAPEDFGLIGLALSVTAMADVLHQNGLSQVVIQRGPDLTASRRSIFWLAMVLSTGAALLLLGVSPLIARMFDSPQLVPLIAVLCVAIPINGMSVNPRTKLNTDLDFKALATVSGLQVVVQGIASVGFAAAGLGAMSFALSLPVAALAALLAYRVYAPLDAGWPVDTDSWRSLGRDTGALLSTSWLAKVVDFGDYFILGLFVEPTMVGLYFFAYRLSAQSANIVTRNVGQVLFPALTQLPAGSRRQHRAFLRACHALAGIGVPIAAVLVVFGSDIVIGVFDDRWASATIYVQVLSIASLARTVGDSYYHLAKAQGLYRELFIWNAVGTICFVVMITAGAAVDGVNGVCIALVFYSVLNSWIRFTLTVRRTGGGARDYWAIIAGPTLAATVATGSVLATLVHALGLADPSLGRLVLGLPFASALYLVLLRAIDPAAFAEVRGIGGRVLRPLRRR